MDIYREQLLDHYRSPRNWGVEGVEGAEARGVNVQCGDEVTVRVVMSEGVVREMRFEGHGCAISIAASSLLSEYVQGKKETQVRALKLSDMETLLGTPLPPARIKCGLLGLETLQLALDIK